MLPYLVLWFWGILLNPLQIKGSKEIFIQNYLFCSITYSFFWTMVHFRIVVQKTLLDFFPVSNLSNITNILLCLHWL